MPEDPQIILEHYDSARSELEKIILAMDSTKAQRTAALNSIEALNAARAQFHIDQVQGRTALLEALIGQLNSVIARVKTNPIGKVLDRLTNIVDKAGELLHQAQPTAAIKARGVPKSATALATHGGGTIVIDPGHGGNVEVGGSSHNNATSPSGVLEKNMLLRMGLLVRDALREATLTRNPPLKVVLTRETDNNLGLSARANVARTHKADLFLSIHYNASEKHNARGVETLIRSKADGNVNLGADKAFAQRIQSAVVNAVRAHDPRTKDRGVKEQRLGVLRDDQLGEGTKACLVEIEFIDRPEVDELLNLGPKAGEVRIAIASAIAGAMIEELDAG